MGLQRGRLRFLLEDTFLGLMVGSGVFVAGFGGGSYAVTPDIGIREEGEYVA